MSHPIVKAARDYAAAEDARKRKRMTGAERAELERALVSLETQSHDPIGWALRGETALAIFGYTADFAEQAATVIADIAWAAQAHGLNPIDVLQTAWSHHLEDRAEAA